MSVWVTIPSARPVEQVNEWAKPWRERGYKIALFRDAGTGKPESDYFASGPYEGYARTVNDLIDAVMHDDEYAEWFVIGGDDVQPDMNHSAEEIGGQCRAHFFQVEYDRGPGAPQSIEACETFGVMQPTGDRWGENPNHPEPRLRSAYIDRIAGSAWIGREFAKRVNQGNGPLWPEYTHMFVDEELREVAVKLGVYWERRDLIHFHNHPGRARGYSSDMVPEHLKQWNTRHHWQCSQDIFKRRQGEGFPGSEPL